MALAATERILRRHGIGDPVSVILVQHLLRDTADFVGILQESRFDICSVIGISYSSQTEAVDNIKRRKIRVLLPERGSPEMVTEILSREVDKVKGSNVIISDVGGYSAPLFSREGWYRAHVQGVVEETAQGLWRFQAFEAPPLPIVSIAKSPLKAVESPFVGEAVCRSLDEVLFALGTDYRFLRVGVIGFGEIGRSVAHSFQGRGVDVVVYDIDPVRRAVGRALGFRCPSRDEVIREANLLIGATGRESVGWEDALSLSDGTFLASASSKQVEFPIATISARCKLAQSVAANVSSYTTPHGRMIHLINNGFPVNFAGAWSLSPPVGDLLFALLARALCRVSQGDLGAGLHELTYKEEVEVATEWLDTLPAKSG